MNYVISIITFSLKAIITNNSQAVHTTVSKYHCHILSWNSLKIPSWCLLGKAGLDEVWRRDGEGWGGGCVLQPHKGSVIGWHQLSNVFFRILQPCFNLNYSVTRSLMDANCAYLHDCTAFYFTIVFISSGIRGENARNTKVTST